MNDNIAACAGIVQKGDPDRFLGIMAASVPVRELLFPLYAFNIEVARAPWVTQESMIAEMRLQWWRDALDQIAAGATPRRHEVVTPLAETLDAKLVPALDQMIEARRWDIYKDPFEDEADFSRHIDQTAGTLMWTAVAMLGGTEETLARDLGYADGLARWFMAIPEFEAQNRVPLVDGRPESLVKLAQGGLDRLRAIKNTKTSKPSVPALRLGWRAEAILTQVVQTPERVADDALGESDFSKKARLLWRSLRATW